MKIRIWGARGSIPTPLGPKDVEAKICQAIYGMSGVDTTDMRAICAYVARLPALVRGTAGGNTSCIEIQAGDETFIIDAGTGIRKLGLELMKGPCGRGQGRLHMFFSHHHWDHVQGFPYFRPATVPGNRITIYSVHNMEWALAEQQRYPFFPVAVDAEQSEREFLLLENGEAERTDHISFFKAEQEFVRLEPGAPFTVGPLMVNTLQNDHPGAAFSFRFEDKYSTFVYASDAEYKTLEDKAIQARLSFFRDADALIFDSQFSLRDVWASRKNYGHSSALIGVDLARRAGVKKLLLFHHEPAASDERLQAIQALAEAYQANDDSLPPCEVLVAREGLCLNLDRPVAKDFRITAPPDFAKLEEAHLKAQLALLARQVEPAASVIDLSQVRRLTTADLKALVTYSHNRAGGPPVLAAPSPAVEAVINMAGYGDYFDIYPSVEEAMRAVQVRAVPGLETVDQYSKRLEPIHQ